MEKQQQFELIEFYKKLQAKLVIEETRYEIYLAELKSIEPSLEPDRAIEKDIQVRNQLQFIETLHEQEKKLAVRLNTLCKTFNDVEACIFANGIINNLSNKEIAIKCNRTEGTVRNIKSRLMEELKSMVVYGEI